jgi:antitoxin (DNA-binding transcriptional repressor) of toxin-antitoxin stability system
MGSAAANSRIRSSVRTKRSSAAQEAMRPASAGTAKVATVSVGDLRTNFSAVEAKLAKGMRVQVTRRGEVVAEVLPLAASYVPFEEKRKGWLDFLEERKASMRAIWGDKSVDLDTTALISEGRDRDLLL